MDIVLAADSDERGLGLLTAAKVITKAMTSIQALALGTPKEEESLKAALQEQQQATVKKAIFSLSSDSVEDLQALDDRRELTFEEEEAIAKKVHAICRELILSDTQLQKVVADLAVEINKGLGRETNATANIKCFPTYVRELPNGKENGRFLALDLGGTNFRVLLITLGGDVENWHMDSKIYAVPQPVMIGPGTGLFDHIAECLASFIKERELASEILPLGFTFSFPCSQEGLTKARLARWTKGFKCAGVEGEDVVQLMKEAITRRGDVKIKICAVLNDTTGTLMSCAWKNRNCRVGLIVGTGVNACYMEKLDKVELWDGDYEEPQQVVINTEWGAFGDNGVLEHVRTAYDRAVDKESINPGRQLYEKMISGMYMGEVARQVLCRLIEEGLLFDGKGGEALLEKGSFYTKYISEIEGGSKPDEQEEWESQIERNSSSYYLDKAGDWNNCRSILEELGINFATDADCANVRHVCECVSRRAAYLAGAGVALLLNRMGELNVTVAVDGSVFRFHPHFHRLMKQQIRKLANSNIKFDVMLSEDGSGRGAALVAAVAYRQQQEALEAAQENANR